MIVVVVASDREIAGMTINVTPPRSAESLVIASSDGSQIGHKSATGALSVAQDGKIATRLNRANGQIGLEVPLLDVSGDTVGVLSLSCPRGAATAAPQDSAERIRDRLRHHIANVGIYSMLHTPST
jgi:hypothetical protein